MCIGKKSCKNCKNGEYRNGGYDFEHVHCFKRENKKGELSFITSDYDDSEFEWEAQHCSDYVHRDEEDADKPMVDEALYYKERSDKRYERVTSVDRKIEVLNPKKGDVLFVRANSDTQGEGEYLLVFDSYDKNLRIVASVAYGYGSDSIWDNYNTCCDTSCITEIRLANESERDFLSSRQKKYDCFKKESAITDALANHLAKEMNYATEVGTGDGSIKAVVYKETPKDEYEELRKADRIYVYERFSREITECPIDEVDGCLFYIFKYKGERASFNARGATVQTLGRGGFKSDVRSCLVSPDKRNFKWIKESDNYVLDDIRRDIITKVEQIIR